MVRRERLDDGRDIGHRSNDGEPRRHAGAFQMTRDLIAHHLGLFEHLRGERIALTRAGLVDDDRKRRLQTACARLPTWVRARSTISRLASINALVSRASGAISSGKLPSSRSLVPERML